MNTSLKRLIIDTATPYLYIALYEGENKLKSVYQKGNNDHSVTLMDQIETMFKALNWRVSMLDQIIVGIGPGSYTGVRIGTVVAKMFAWSHNIDIYQVTSTALLASGAKPGKILAYIDARRDQAFAGVYQKTADDFKVVLEATYGDLTTMKKTWDYDHVVKVNEPDLNVLLNSEGLKRVTNVHTLTPMYLRKTEAERNKASEND